MAHGVIGDSFWCNISLYTTHEDRKRVVPLRVKKGSGADTVGQGFRIAARRFHHLSGIRETVGLTR